MRATPLPGELLEWADPPVPVMGYDNPQESTSHKSPKIVEIRDHGLHIHYLYIYTYIHTYLSIMTYGF